MKTHHWGQVTHDHLTVALSQLDSVTVEYKDVAN